MQSSLLIAKTIAYVWPLELDVASSDVHVNVVSNLDQILDHVECNSGLIWIFYPLLGRRELLHPQLVAEWLSFYGPLVALRSRGIECLVFKAKDSVPEFGKNENQLLDPLLVKLGCQLHPDAFEVQDQLELFASDLNRPPVFAPRKLVFDSAEITHLIQAVHNLQPIKPTEKLLSMASSSSERLYKEKSELLLAQLRLLQSEFVQQNEELNRLREESLLTADLIAKAGGRFLKS